MSMSLACEKNLRFFIKASTSKYIRGTMFIISSRVRVYRNYGNRQETSQSIECVRVRIVICYYITKWWGMDSRLILWIIHGYSRPTENTSYSAMLNIPESVPLRNWFRPVPELIPTSSGIDSDQFRNSLNWVEEELEGIPSNSGRFRNRSTLHVHQAITCLQSIWFRYGIPRIESRRHWKEFLGIPSDSGRFRNCTISHVLSSPLTLTPSPSSLDGYEMIQ
jgi:hypothetical protein